MNNLTAEEKTLIAIRIITLFASSSEKRDMSNAISDAVLFLRKDGHKELTSEKARQFFELVETETAKDHPGFVWPDPEWVPKF